MLALLDDLLALAALAREQGMTVVACERFDRWLTVRFGPEVTGAPFGGRVVKVLSPAAWAFIRCSVASENWETGVGWEPVSAVPEAVGEMVGG